MSCLWLQAQISYVKKIILVLNAICSSFPDSQLDLLLKTIQNFYEEPTGKIEQSKTQAEVYISRLLKSNEINGIRMVRINKREICKD